MKKILVCTLALLIVCAFPLFAFAEETTDSVIETTESVSETTDSVGETTETVTDTAIVPPADEPSETAPPEEDLKVLLSKKFEEWVVPNLEEISVVITMIGTLFYQIRKNKLLTKSMGVMNNNTVTIAEQSSNMMTQALTGMENVSAIVTAYDARIKALLEAHKATAEDKERLEREIAEIRTYLKTSAESNIEFANELAELLGLANIPNYKKEEIGARHLAAVKSIKTAETEALNAVQTSHTEVMEDVGEEA